MRQTSIETYNKIEAFGLLTEARFIVYKILYNNGPLTAGDIFEIGKKLDAGHTIVKGSICARLTELERQGVICEVGTKIWEATGQIGTLWDVTENIPIKLEKKKSKDQIIKELKEEIANLKLHLQQSSMPYKQGLLL